MFEFLGKNTSWQVYSFGDFLSINNDSWIAIDDNTNYQILGVTSKGKGLVIKRLVNGIELKMRNYQVARPNQLMWCKVDTTNGAFGVTKNVHSGALSSPNMCLANINTQICLPDFLQLFFQIPSVYEGLTNASLGTTNRQYLKPQELLKSVRLHLPSLEDQDCIVRRIEALAARVSEALSLRERAVEETKAILSSLLHNFFMIGTMNWARIPMTEAIAINDKQVDPKLPEYAHLPHISGENIESRTCKLLPYRTAEEDGVKSSNYLFSPDTILYSKIRPYLQKAIYVDFKGVCSADIYPIKVANNNLDIRFVMWSLVASPFSEYSNRISGRTRMPKLNRQQIFAFEFSYPPLDEQRRIVAHLDAVQAKVDELRRLQAETQEQLSALMPSILDRAFKGEL